LPSDDLSGVLSDSESVPLSGQVSAKVSDWGWVPLLDPAWGVLSVQPLVLFHGHSQVVIVNEINNVDDGVMTSDA
jgi:hypothetical protein